MPKSVSRILGCAAVPSSSMFSGFTSRCTMPAACTAASPSSNWHASRTASAGGSVRRACRQATQVLSLDQLHDDGQDVTLRHQVNDLNHVRVVNGRQDRPFLKKPRHYLRIRYQL